MLQNVFKADIGQFRVHALNEIINQTNEEKETIIALFCPKIITFNVQIWFQLFIGQLYQKSLFIFPYDCFLLAIQGGCEKRDEITIPITTSQKQVSHRPLPNTPFKFVDSGM